MMTVQELWADYIENMGLEGSSDTQIRDLKRSYYAGAYGLLHLINQINAGKQSKNASARMLIAISDELSDFGKGIKRNEN